MSVEEEVATTFLAELKLIGFGTTHDFRHPPGVGIFSVWVRGDYCMYKE